MRECAILSGGTRAGTLRWEREGLYWRFDAVLDPYPGVRRLEAYDASGRPLRLGIPAPEGRRMRLRHTVSGTQLLWEGFALDGALTAALLPVLPAGGGTREAFPPDGVVPAPEELTRRDPAFADCPTHGLYYRPSTKTLLEPFEPTRPLALAPWYRRLRVETVGGKRCLSLRF